jgi:hypothetical protein
VIGTAVVVAVALLCAITRTVDTPHVAVLGGVLVFAIWAVPALGESDAVDWPAEQATFVKAGVRSDVARLGWRLRTREGYIDSRAVVRAWHVAATRLGGHGVSWDDFRAGEPTAVAEAERLLGPAVAAGLRRELPRVGMREFTRWVAALDRLDAADAGLDDDEVAS